MISWFRVNINILPLFIFVRFLANSFLSPEQTYFLKKMSLCYYFVMNKGCKNESSRLKIL